MSIYEVVAEPKRRQILDLLLQRPHSVGEMVAELEISQPGVSKHLRVLRESGLVEVRQEAQLRWYELRPEPLAEIDRWLADYRQKWAESFDKLDNYLLQFTDKEAENESE
jgi:DNA-binding transcriptional ArsR family regulator